MRYHYSEDNLVTKVTGRYETGDDRETFVIAKNLQFNPESQRLTGLTYGNGLKTKFNYSETNKLQFIKTLNNGELIDRASYIRDEGGNITNISRLNAANSVRYGYDGFGRLIHEQKGIDTATQFNISYNYDAVGNRLAYDNGAKQNAYVYGPQANRLDEINRKTLSYDVRGNLINDRKGKRSFTYDVTNRMSAFYKNDELKASYEYNAFGQRVVKTLHRSQREDDSYRSLHFAYSPDGWLLSEFGRDSDKKRTFARDYVWLGARPLAQIERKMRPDGTTRKAKVSFLHTDHLNTPRWASDTSGKTVWRWDSDGFGKGKANRDVDGDGKKTVIRLRFAGQYHDRESGLYYNHHRDYDPSLGRYIQSDPIGLKGGINRYAYVLGNPISYIDPDGLRTLLRYSCVTTALVNPTGGWVPGSNITKCNPYLIEIPEYTNLINAGSDLGGGGNGGITQVAGPMPQILPINSIQEHLDRGLENLCQTLEGMASNLDQTFERANQLGIIRLPATAARQNLPWKYLEFAGGGGNGLGGGGSIGIAVHTNGQYFAFARGALGAYGGGDAGVSIGYSSAPPGGIGMDFGYTWPGARVSGGLFANDSTAGINLQAGLSIGASLYGLISYTASRDCGSIQ